MEGCIWGRYTCSFYTYSNLSADRFVLLGFLYVQRVTRSMHAALRYTGGLSYTHVPGQIHTIVAMTGTGGEPFHHLDGSLDVVFVIQE